MSLEFFTLILPQRCKLGGQTAKRDQENAYANLLSLVVVRSGDSILTTWGSEMYLAMYLGTDSQVSQVAREV